MVKYKGMRCELFEHYFSEDDGPYLKLRSPCDLESAYKESFQCMGYPDEVMKKLTREEYERQKNEG